MSSPPAETRKLPNFAPILKASLGPALNSQGRAVDEIAAPNGISNKVTYLVYSHHHADHAGASSLFDKKGVRIGHEETRRLRLRNNDPARPAPEETFQDRRTLSVAGERIELAWHGSNHSPTTSISICQTATR
jgi:glyoxylase-like metal-dependent hydrolase (beta-lactamase superfamily II)